MPRWYKRLELEKVRSSPLCAACTEASEKLQVEEESTPGWIRTSNHRFRRPVLYPVELRVLCFIAFATAPYLRESGRLPQERLSKTTCPLFDLQKLVDFPFRGQESSHQTF